MDIALIIGLLVVVGIPLLLLLCWLFWSFFILSHLEKKWARDSAEEFDELWNKHMKKR